VRRVLSQLAAALILAGLSGTAHIGAAKPPDWFTGHDPLPLRLEAPFKNLFAHAQQNGYTVRGSLSWRDRAGDGRLDDVKVNVRGHTSRRETECSFPKLKLAWPGGSLKIGTHCGESRGDELSAKYGRLANQSSPLREEFVYRLLDTLGVPTLHARPAQITYVDTEADDERDVSVTRHAFLLESEENARARLGAVRTVTPEQFTNARDAFTPEDTARLAFAEALVGNFDWCLRFSKGDTYRCDGRRPLWNVLAFTWPDGTMRPLPYDFDVTGIVAGHHLWFADIFNEAFLPSRSQPAIEVIAQLQHARSLFPRDVLDATRRAFASRKAAAYRALAQSAVDAGGKKTFTEYMDAFFEAMTSDAAFYRPVVTVPNTRAYADADRSTPVCASAGPVPVGTPVSEPVQTRGDMAQVIVLDAMWKFAPPVKCPFIHQNPVWIPRAAVGTNYP
jgi:hypothetical protein